MLATPLIYIACTGLGCGLLVRGLVGRKVPIEPRCRNCHYLLAGITSKVCPECGQTLSAGPQREVRKQKWRTLVCGVVLLAATFLAWHFKAPNQIDRFVAARRYLNWFPQSWLVRAASNGSVDALAELRSRIHSDQVSVESCEELAAMANAWRKRDRDSPAAQAWGDILGLLESRHSLSAGARLDFLDSIIECRLQVRSRQQRGIPLPARIVMTSATPIGNPYFWKLSLIKTEVAGTPHEDGHEFAGVTRGYSQKEAGAYSVDTSTAAPGKTNITHDVALELFESDPAIGDEQPTYRREFKMTASTEIVSNANDEPRLDLGRGQLPDFAAKFSTDWRHATDEYGTSVNQYFATLRLPAAPGCSVAANANLVVDGLELPLGSVLINNKLDQARNIVFGFRVPREVEWTRPFIVLRYSQALAAQLIDTDCVCTGTLRIPLECNSPS